VHRRGIYWSFLDLGTEDNSSLLDDQMMKEPFSSEKQPEKQ
jgi:hypothetical protein